MNQGPVGQSIIRLTKSLIAESLNLVVHIKLSVLILVFAEIHVHRL